MRINPDRISQVLKDFAVPYKENGEVFFALPCPSCGKRKAYLTKKAGVYACWSCAELGVKGKAAYWLGKLTGQTTAHIQNIIDEPLSADEESELILEDEDIVDPPLEMFKTVWPVGFWPMDALLSKPAVAYLADRGISLDLAMEYGLRYSPAHQRVCFPIETQGVFLGYQGRLIVPEKGVVNGLQFVSPKYLTSKGVPKERALMFYNRLEGASQAIIAEGPFDAMKLHLAGGNVATIGKSVSEKQISMISASDVCIALDTDAPKQIENLAAKLIAAGKTVWVAIPPKKDFGDCSLEEALSCIEYKLTYDEWYFEKVLP